MIRGALPGSPARSSGSPVQGGFSALELRAASAAERSAPEDAAARRAALDRALEALGDQTLAGRAVESNLDAILGALAAPVERTGHLSPLAQDGLRALALLAPQLTSAQATRALETLAPVLPPNFSEPYISGAPYRALAALEALAPVLSGPDIDTAIQILRSSDALTFPRSAGCVNSQDQRIERVLDLLLPSASPEQAAQIGSCKGQYAHRRNAYYSPQSPI